MERDFETVMIEQCAPVLALSLIHIWSVSLFIYLLLFPRRSPPAVREQQQINKEGYRPMKTYLITGCAGFIGSRCV